MFTLIALAATTSIMTLAITLLGIAVLSVKDLIDGSEFMNLRAAGFAKPSIPVVVTRAA